MCIREGGLRVEGIEENFDSFFFLLYNEKVWRELKMDEDEDEDVKEKVERWRIYFFHFLFQGNIKMIQFDGLSCEGKDGENIKLSWNLYSQKYYHVHLEESKD